MPYTVQVKRYRTTFLVYENKNEINENPTKPGVKPYETMKKAILENKSKNLGFVGFSFIWFLLSYARNCSFMPHFQSIF